MENSLELSVINALSFLNKSVHALISADMDSFLGSIFSSSSSYENTEQDKLNLTQLEQIELFHAEIKKIQHSITSWHPGENSYSAPQRYKRINNMIHDLTSYVSKLERIAQEALQFSEEDIAAKISLIGGYRSCRESYITVSVIINTYNGYLKDKYEKDVKSARLAHSSTPEKPLYLSDLSIPKDIALPK